MAVKVISADCHINEPPHVFERVPEEPLASVQMQVEAMAAVIQEYGLYQIDASQSLDKHDIDIIAELSSCGDGPELPGGNVLERSDVQSVYLQRGPQHIFALMGNDIDVHRVERPAD